METFIIGDSEDCEAEYGQCADAPFTVIGLYDNENFIVYGVASIAVAKAELLADGAEKSQISVL